MLWLGWDLTSNCSENEGSSCSQSHDMYGFHSLILVEKLFRRRGLLVMQRCHVESVVWVPLFGFCKKWKLCLLVWLVALILKCELDMTCLCVLVLLTCDFQSLAVYVGLTIFNYFKKLWDLVVSPYYPHLFKWSHSYVFGNSNYCLVTCSFDLYLIKCCYSFTKVSEDLHGW